MGHSGLGCGSSILYSNCVFRFWLMFDQTMRFWSWKSGQCVKLIEDFGKIIDSVAYSNSASDAVLRSWSQQQQQVREIISA